MIEGYVTTANQKLERWETIKRFEILPAEFTVDEARSPEPEDPAPGGGAEVRRSARLDVRRGLTGKIA